MKNFCIGDEVLNLIDKNRKTGVILDIFDDHHLKYKVKWNGGGVGRCSSKAITSYSPSIPILEDYKVTVSDNTGPFKYEECSYPSQYSLNVHEELTKQAERYIYQFNGELEEKAKEHLKKRGWMSPEEQEENIAKLDSEYISIEEHERIVREDKIDAYYDAISACQEEYKTVLTRLADEVFEKAYMDLTMWKAEELKQLILDKINDDSLS